MSIFSNSPAIQYFFALLLLLFNIYIIYRAVGITLLPSLPTILIASIQKLPGPKIFKRKRSLLNLSSVGIIYLYSKYFHASVFSLDLTIVSHLPSNALTPPILMRNSLPSFLTQKLIINESPKIASYSLQKPGEFHSPCALQLCT